MHARMALFALVILVPFAGCRGSAQPGVDAAVESECDDGLDDDGDGRIDCMDPDCAASPGCIFFEGPARSPPALDTRNLDLLFVVDNSGSFFGTSYHVLVEQLRQMMTRLRDTPGGLPNLHVGVTSTDLGAGGHHIMYCEAPGGDDGRLLTGMCQNPVGYSFIIDVAPLYCEITLDEQGHCTAHNCDQASCGFGGSYVNPYITLAVDERGCPRCRNYEGESLEDVFACIANLGTWGCAFEQPLEAMRRALSDISYNLGFVRQDARLAVVIVTNEDDCSASTPELFDTSQTDLTSPLGPLTSFRCFEHGITCHDDDRFHEGIRTGCLPRDDPEALLHPIGRYVDFVSGFVGNPPKPGPFWAGVVAGPAEDATALVGRDSRDQPELEAICTTADVSAVPAIRLRAFVDALRASPPHSGMMQSICEDGFSQVMDDLVDFLGTWTPPCFPKVLSGCSDPAAAEGLGGDDHTCNDLCRPRCEVIEIFSYSTSRGSEVIEQRLVVPPCLEICPDGPCIGNTYPALAYLGGRPPYIDPELPTRACWYIRHDERCGGSRGASLAFSHRSMRGDTLSGLRWPENRFEAYCFALTDPSDPDCDQGP